MGNNSFFEKGQRQRFLTVITWMSLSSVCIEGASPCSSAVGAADGVFGGTMAGIDDIVEMVGTRLSCGISV